MIQRKDWALLTTANVQIIPPDLLTADASKCQSNQQEATVANH